MADNVRLGSAINFAIHQIHEYITIRIRRHTLYGTSLVYISQFQRHSKVSWRGTFATTRWAALRCGFLWSYLCPALDNSNSAPWLNSQHNYNFNFTYLNLLSILHRIVSYSIRVQVRQVLHAFTVTVPVSFRSTSRLVVPNWQESIFVACRST
jgi:hypothetical protein